ncbi:ribosomal protein L28 [Orientia chuto str. Dubai]|uniref:Large ribosomal subunit protein bL28 n=1 Tax=Orientia chuto str. Dubai TaxID=1359168 RepID=A0A0F3MP54_9RICK|nr:50S ribosomal protein L28 [Candidatus Orientia mediorientalis]KJV57530.1 ribosomal protein L28 [Orientia chuto str. Dubai]
MSRVCELTGIAVQSGNNVSHSQRKTKRKFLPNLQNVSLFSDILKKTFKFKVAARAMRTLDKVGGLDCYLLSTSDKVLSKSALAIKNIIKNNNS